MKIPAARRIFAVLVKNPIFQGLAADVVARHALRLETAQDLTLPDGRPSGLRVTPFAAPD